MNDHLHLAVIIGSTRQGRFAPNVTRWFLEQLDHHGRYDVDVIDLADLGLPAHLGSGDGEQLAAYRARLDAADAFVVVTPEYNHAYPAGLKQAIDLAKAEWYAKPVAFVSYGGRSGGSRAVEQLRLVFAELHAVTVRDVVMITRPWSRMHDGVITETGEEPFAATMLSQLEWWAETLRDARHARPYAA